MRERLREIARALAEAVEALAEGRGTWQAVSELRAEAEALREAVAFAERREREQAEAAHRARLAAAEEKLAAARQREGEVRAVVNRLAGQWQRALNAGAPVREAAAIEAELVRAKAEGVEAARARFQAEAEVQRVARRAPTAAAPPAA